MKVNYVYSIDGVLVAVGWSRSLFRKREIAAQKKGLEPFIEKGGVKYYSLEVLMSDTVQNPPEEKIQAEKEPKAHIEKSQSDLEAFIGIQLERKGKKPLQLLLF